MTLGRLILNMFPWLGRASTGGQVLEPGENKVSRVDRESMLGRTPYLHYAVPA